MAKMNTLHDLFVEQLKDVYSAEKQLVAALPKMARAASSPELKQAFEEHLRKTEEQKQRLDMLFERIGEKPGRKKCKGMEGLIAEGQELMIEDAAPEVLDAGLIAAAQKVEHYEMATYGTLRTFAKMMGHDDTARVLQETLNEEGWTDEFLTKIAESDVNWKAQEAPEMGGMSQSTSRSRSSSGSRTGSSGGRSASAKKSK